MKPLPNSLDLPVESSGRICGINGSTFLKDHILVNYSWNEASSELCAELTITEYPPHVRNLLTQTVTHEEIRIYSGARVECENFVRHNYQGGGTEPLRLVIKAAKKPNIERAITWIRRLLDQAMNLPKFKEKVLIGLENASASFDVRGKVLGPGGANLQYITNETGAIVTLRGRGSGFIEPTTGLESIEPLHLCVEHNSKYEVLQAGRQLAFNLIETVQQEWYSFQQQQQQQPVQQQQSVQQHVPTAPQSHHGAVVCNTGNTNQLVSVPPPSTAVPPPSPAVPPLITTSVPPPLIHQPPPPPQPTHMQLSASLNQLVQGPPPQIQPGQLNQPPPVHQLVAPGHHGQLLTVGQQGGLMAQSHAQAGQQGSQLVQQSHQQLLQPGQVIQAGQIVQSPQSHLVEQSQNPGQQHNLSLVHQGQPTSLLQAQQALSQAVVLPGSGGGVQVVQTSGSGGAGGVQVLQAGQLSAAALQQQTALQEIPHVYSGAGGGNAGPGGNVLTQQVLAPQASIIAQQPHIISQASYPLQYIQSAGGGGGMAVMYGGTASGGNNAARDSVMLVQYSGNAATRSRLQPQIVQLVHPGTGQVVGAAPLLLQAPPSPLLLQQHAASVPPGLLLQQHAAAAQAPSSLLLSQHQLQFAQPQPVQLVSQPPPQMMTVNTSSQQGVVTSSVAVAVSSAQSSNPRTVQAQKRRYDHESNNVSSPGAISVSEVSSPHHSKKGVGDEATSSKIARDQVLQQASQQNNNKLLISTTQSDEPDQQSSQRVDLKAEMSKRGRLGPVDNEDKECKTIYSYGNNKLLAGGYQQQAALLQQSLAQPQQHVLPHQLQAESIQQALASHQVQGLPPATIGVGAAQGVVPPPQFTSPPPNYPPQYYQQPYQTYQPSWNHMHNSGQ